jgi:hypothetical protein
VELVVPDGLTTDVDGVVELGADLALLAGEDDTDATALGDTGSKEPDTGLAARAEVDGVGGGLGEVTSLGPVDVLGEDLVAELLVERARELAEVRA